MWILLACRALHLPPHPVPTHIDPVVPGTQMYYYDLVGSDPVDVVAALAQHGPLLDDIHHAAVTTYVVEWRYPAGPTDGSAPPCDLDYVDVMLDLHTRFPRWVIPPDADTAAVHEWTRYTQALAAHESEHVILIRSMAEAIPHTLRAMGCAGASTDGKTILRAMELANQDLDHRTEGGATTGARLAWLHRVR